jgi:lipopolysaccharide transport system permease protein
VPRYRDLEQVISSVLQLAFYMTPVIWKSEFLGENSRWLLYFNPFAIYISIVRHGLLSEPAGWLNWILALFIAVAGFGSTLALVGKYHRRMIFWI